ncbi:MAG: penicillin acylase family protein [Candidatus Tumulicola sp.]
MRRLTTRERDDLVRDLCRPLSLWDAVAVRAYRHGIGLLLASTALALAYAAGAGWGFRAHALTAGRIVEPSLHARVTIVRDRRDVPHVVAGSQRDLFFAQGFVEGSDRLFQMELTRRYATGTLSEVLGPRALPIDEEQRYYDVRDIAERQWRAMDVADRTVLGAFSDGVNAAMRQQPLPIEFRLLLYRPQPWRPQDSLAVSLAVSIALADSWHDVLARNDVWKRYGARRFDADFPLSDGSYDVTLSGSPVRPRRSLPGGTAVALRFVRGGESAGLRTPKAGSNAWAAGGARTLDRRALLANDPHLDLTIPGFWYLEDLRAPGFHVAGASIPGSPGVLLGHNERIAWAATNADASAMSVFDAGNLAPKSWKQEVFHVRFSPDVTRAYYRTAREFAVPNAYDGGRLALVRWPAYASKTSAVPAFLALDRALTSRAAMRVLAGYRGTAENFVVADVRGNVAYHLAGSVPLDPAWGRFVHPARDLRLQFAAIPFAALPARAPSQTATIVSANNKMYRDGYPYRIAATFEPPYRAYRIAALLHARQRYSAAYFGRMQSDTVSPVDLEFARLAGAAIARAGDETSFGAIARELASWNGAFSPGSRAATVEHALRARLEEDAPSFYAVLREFRRGDNADVDSDLRGALYSNSLPQPWGRAGSVRIEHPLAPLRFGFLNGATLPGDGDEYTIHLQEPGFSQSFRAVWEPGNWDAGGISIPSGESGEPGSGHYDDLSTAWIAGSVEPLPFSERAVRAATRERLILEPQSKF